MICSSLLLPFLFNNVGSFSIAYPLCINKVAFPPSSTISCGPLPPGNVNASFVHHQYSSSVSPFHANTGMPLLAIAAAAYPELKRYYNLPISHLPPDLPVFLSILLSVLSYAMSPISLPLLMALLLNIFSLPTLSLASLSLLFLFLSFHNLLRLCLLLYSLTLFLVITSFIFNIF